MKDQHSPSAESQLKASRKYIVLYCIVLYFITKLFYHVFAEYHCRDVDNDEIKKKTCPPSVLSKKCMHSRSFTCKQINKSLKH